jgi:hypothetical protein
MGADLYLSSVFDANKAKHEPAFKAAVAKRDALPRGSDAANLAQKEVNAAYNAMMGRGYFRDCYNSGGLFAQMSLSWWKDVVPMLDDEGNLPIPKARELLERVTAEPLTLGAIPTTDEVQKVGQLFSALTANSGLTVEAGRDVPDETQRAEYEAWRDALVALLTESIMLNEPLYCSL